MTAAPIFNRFVALGDSTTEGLDDPYPGGVPGQEVYRGWADRLADRLAAINPRLEYANLAVRGRKIKEIREQQLQPALAMKPDLASVVGGVNDVLRPKVSIEGVASQIEAMQRTLVASGATVISMTLPDIGDSMRVARIVSDRLKRYNQRVRDAAARTGAIVVDLEEELGAYDPRGWSRDKLHASSAGHEMIALAAAKRLGVPNADRDLKELKATAPHPERLPPTRAAAAEAAWVWAHLLPWITRRVRGTSSGDGVEPKRPSMAPYLPQAQPSES